MAQQESFEVEFIPLAAVRRIAGCSESEVWRRVRRGTMPKPIRFGAKCTRWSRAEVLAWAHAQIENRDASVPAEQAAA